MTTSVELSRDLVAWLAVLQLQPVWDTVRRDARAIGVVQSVAQSDGWCLGTALGVCGASCAALFGMMDQGGGGRARTADG